MRNTSFALFMIYFRSASAHPARQGVSSMGSFDRKKRGCMKHPPFLNHLSFINILYLNKKSKFLY